LRDKTRFSPAEGGEKRNPVAELTGNAVSFLFEGAGRQSPTEGFYRSRTGAAHEKSSFLKTGIHKLYFI
jgi:hypothetical protein